MDDLIAASGVSYRALVMPSFTDNVLRQIVPIREHGTLLTAIAPDRALPTCATRDIAARAAELLDDRECTGVAEVPLLGPEDLSFDDMAATIADVLGTPVVARRIPLDTLRGNMIGIGMSEAMADGMTDMIRAKDEGLTRTAENSSPTSFRTWCEEELRPAIDPPSTARA